VLKKALSEQQAASQGKTCKLEKEFHAQKLQMEHRLRVLEATLKKKELAAERAKEEIRQQNSHISEQVRMLEQALAQEKDNAQRQIQGLQSELAQAQRPRTNKAEL
jgi:SMC interacting uncharacterized protein involved in chromosome segregation